MDLHSGGQFSVCRITRNYGWMVGKFIQLWHQLESWFPTISLLLTCVALFAYHQYRKLSMPRFDYAISYRRTYLNPVSDCVCVCVCIFSLCVSLTMCVCVRLFGTRFNVHSLSALYAKAKAKAKAIIYEIYNIYNPSNVQKQYKSACKRRPLLYTLHIL